MINPRHYSFTETRTLTVTRTDTGWNLALTHWCPNADALVTSSSDVDEEAVAALAPIDTADCIYQCLLCGESGQVQEGQWIPS